MKYIEINIYFCCIGAKCLAFYTEINILVIHFNINTIIVTLSSFTYFVQYILHVLIFTSLFNDYISFVHNDNLFLEHFVYKYIFMSTFWIYSNIWHFLNHKYFFSQIANLFLRRNYNIVFIWFISCQVAYHKIL